MLVQLAERLRLVADELGGTVARAGGDDFVVLDGSTRTFDDARDRVERVTTIFARPFTIGDDTVFVTSSVGVAMAPRNRTITAEELMRRADIATHRAKADGRNRTVMFDDSMQSTLTHRMDVEHALHGAAGRQELRLYHQPIVDLESGQLTGFEALIRWQRDGVVVQPSDFIPIAEETGIINEIGAWALREALLDLRRWMDDGVISANITMSVNVSPRQIADPGFAAVVRDALDQSGVSPHLLWIEMTESMMLDEPELAENTLRRIRSMGVRLALDDFGTGYSSLSLLQQFPIQRIKIDRAFVQGIADRSNDRSLVRTIIAMAQSMGLDLVAEGVETVHQLQSLPRARLRQGAGLSHQQARPLRRHALDDGCPRRVLRPRPVQRCRTRTTGGVHPRALARAGRRRSRRPRSDQPTDGDPPPRLTLIRWDAPTATCTINHTTRASNIAEPAITVRNEYMRPRR